eukprot:363885-Chlamydomonas_euryale.AAC.28
MLENCNFGPPAPNSSPSVRKQDWQEHVCEQRGRGVVGQRHAHECTMPLVPPCLQHASEQAREA